MSDLVERLRSWAQNEEMINQHYRVAASKDGWLTVAQRKRLKEATDHWKDCLEAADALEAQAQKMCGDLAACESKQASIEAKDAEIERLRKELMCVSDDSAMQQMQADAEIERLRALADDET